MTIALYAAMVFLAIGFVFCLLRAFRGPSAYDRVLALDCLALQSLGLVLIFSILTRTDAYIDVILIVGLLGFVGTVSFAFYMGERTDD